MPQKLRPLLGAHPDSELYAKVLTNGFFLSYQGEHCELISRNSISISKNLDIAEQKIAEEVKLGIIAGPYPSPPLPNFKCCPLALGGKKKKAQKVNLNYFMTFLSPMMTPPLTPIFLTLLPKSPIPPSSRHLILLTTSDPVF